MNEKKLGVILKIAAVFLVVSVAFCIFAIAHTTNQKQYMEQRRLDNETEIAMMQMPTFEPAQETEDIDAVIAQAGEYASDNSEPSANTDTTGITANKTVVVIDAGHGKSSSAMSTEEKRAEGYVYNESRGSWGEWRHYKNGTFGVDCGGSGCTQTAPSNGSCWYPMGNGDRDKEPEINLNNALAAKKYLEEMGYEVRMTRTSNEQNPSMSKRVSYCFPDNDTTQTPDAAAFVCLHSNAGGGSGTSYISLEDTYTQEYIPSDYNSASNALGNLINNKVAAASGLRENPPIGNEGYLILFNKCPVPIAYMEIGFFDSGSDLSILNSSSDAIGKAVAEGVDEYLRSN